MRHLDSRPGRMGKMTGVEDSVLDLARERLRVAYEQFDTVVVSFSGGKDSTVCLNLTLEVARELGRLPLRVFFYDEEAIPYQTEDYVRRVAGMEDVCMEWYCLPVRHRNGCSNDEPHWWPWAPEARDLWVRDLPPEAITALDGFPNDPPEARYSVPESAGLLFDPRRDGTVGMVMGIRTQESITRLRAIVAGKNKSEPYLIPYTDLTSNGSIHKVYPIYDWQTADVWTAPARFGWDYNRAYDAMEMAGIGHLAQRCAPPYGEQPMQGLNTFKVAFPEIWDRMAYRVPGARTAAMYSRTELYGFGAMPQKPEDMAWGDFLAAYVEAQPEDIRPGVAKRIQNEIRLHYSKTDEPILAVPHPVTGVDWKFLMKIAMRGDLKRREQPLNKAAGREEQARTAYDLAKAEDREKRAARKKTGPRREETAE